MCKVCNYTGCNCNLIGCNWCVGLGRRGLCEGAGNCLKYLKRGLNRKRGNKHFKSGQAGSRGGWLKKHCMESNPTFGLQNL